MLCGNLIYRYIIYIHIHMYMYTSVQGGWRHRLDVLVGSMMYLWIPPFPPPHKQAGIPALVDEPSYVGLLPPPNAASPRFTDLTLHGYWRSSATWRVRIALALKGLQYEYMAVPLLKGEHQTAGCVGPPLCLGFGTGGMVCRFPLLPL